ncbi:MAG TPA: hypothetical protein VNN08_22945 [Thermoanaerobaculia bacterium]|nr:hypothetical protein [Thermoanaerobaculia bacterium]
MPEIIPVAPADFRIDELNPRISSPNAGQVKALHALARHLGPKLKVLAADIVQYGIDPSTLPIVMPLPGVAGKYIVLEGNRRLAALKALENPDSVAGAVEPGVLRQIRKLSKDYQANPIDTLLCVLVADREEARHWIELRHGGEALGAGISRWSSDEADRFRSRSGVSKPHTQLLDFLQRHGDLSEELRRKVPVTTLERLIGAPSVRNKLGVELHKKIIYLLAQESLIAKALMYVVNDLVTKNTNVGSVYNKELREKYAASIPGNIVVTPTLKSGYGVAASNAGTGVKPKAAAGAARTPKKRDRLIPRECVLGIPAGRLRDMETELSRRLSLENHANAISVLFRVFLELSVDTYNAKNLPAVSEGSALRVKTEAAVTDLVTRKKLTKKQAHPVLVACEKDTFLAASVVMLNQYVHNPFVFPAPDDLRAHWDSFQPFVSALWAP